MLARKGKKLSDQISRPVGILFNLHDIGKRLLAGSVTLKQEVAKPDHRRQQIVEIMGDTSGKLTDRLHFLGLGELDLKVFKLGRIKTVNNEPRQIAVIILQAAGEE